MLCPFSHFFSLLDLPFSASIAHTSKYINVPMTQTPCCEHHPMWMKRRTSDWTALGGRQEGSVRVDSIDGVAIDIKDGESVGIRSAV